MDHLTVRERSENMSKIRSKDTKPEKAVRKILSGMGFKYRLHSKKLPGKPDIVIASRKTAVFINGCFWHQHENCKRKTMPKTNSEYWKSKLTSNVDRQKEELAEIKELGFKPVIIWECQTLSQEALAERIMGVFA